MIFEQHIPNRGFLPWGKVSPQKAVQGHLEVFHGEPKGAGDQVDAEFFHLIEGEGVDFFHLDRQHLHGECICNLSGCIPFGPCGWSQRTQSSLWYI